MIRINLIAFSALILLITQSNVVFSQDYIPMNFEEGVWIEKYDEYMGKTERIQRECFGDTLIDNQVYYKLYAKKIVESPSGYYPDTLEWDFTGLIGNMPDRTVQLYSKTNPITLIDFNLEVGDSIIAPDGFVAWIVRKIDSVEICGRFHKRYSGSEPGCPLDSTMDNLIEGVGYSNGGLLAYFNFWRLCGSGETTYELSCYGERSNTECGSCAIFSNVSTFNVNLKIFPNPFNDQININSEQPILNYRIYNLYGKIVKSENSQFTSYKILETGNLPPGLYLIQVQFIDRSTSSLKMIKY